MQFWFNVEYIKYIKRWVALNNLIRIIGVHSSEIFAIVGRFPFLQMRASFWQSDTLIKCTLSFFDNPSDS
jgi:hypothetical protein